MFCGAYLEWAAAQTDPAEAADAYGSAYITARTEADVQAALLGLIDGLGARATQKLLQDADHSFHVPTHIGHEDAEVGVEMLDALAPWFRSFF